jgi:hypothetical protein
MTNRRLKMIRWMGAAGAAFLLSNLALAQPQTIEGGQTNRVSIEYVEPINSEFRDLYEVLKTHRALEQVQKILSPMRLPEELMVKTTECGQVNAWYRREHFVPTVVICYELLKHVWESLPHEAAEEGITPDDAKIGQVLWTTLHEVGHATFDIFDVPIFGDEEHVADNFATYIMLQFVEARRLIVGAAWAWNEYMQDYKRNPVVRVRLAGFADSHGLPQERFYNLVCLAYGFNSEKFADLKRYLPATPARNCAHEYFALANAFHKEISPHIDFTLAKTVLEAKWLPDPAPRPGPDFDSASR